MSPLATCFFLFTALALAPLSAQAKPRDLGTGLTKGTPEVKVSALLDKPQDYLGKKVRVRGLITGVCKRRGCWMSIAGDKPHQTIRIKVRDGVIVFPPDVKGKRGAAEGVFTKREISRAQALKFAEHRKKMHGTDYDPAKIKAYTSFELTGTGARIE